MLVRRQPIHVGELGDIREAIFGVEFRYLRFAAVVALIFLVVRVLDAFLFDVTIFRRKHIVAPILLREMISLSLFFVLLAWAISSIFQKSLTGLLATGTVLAAVIGLALQDTLGNLFSGISLHIEHTFEVGDVIRSGDHVGVVERVNWRATRVRTFQDNIVVFPNSVVARERLEVFPQANLNARLVTVGVGYEFPPARVIDVIQRGVSNVPGVSAEIPCLVRIADFAASSITYEIKYWTRTYHLFNNIDAEIRRAAWYALKRNGIRIPYPILSIERHYEAAPPAPITSTDLLRRLSAVDVLHPLSEEEHQWLANSTSVRIYSRGETIIRHGDEGDSMFIVHEGSVSVRVAENGAMREVAQLGAGSVFGEMALLTGESRTADIVALSDATVLEIGKDSLHPILQNNPDLTAAISLTILERRDHLEESRAATEEQRTLMGRIRSYFGLR